MTQKEIDKLTKPLRDERVVHMFLARVRNGVILSSIADGDDIYEFLQVLVEQNPVVLDIMQSVIDARNTPRKPQNNTVVN